MHSGDSRQETFNGQVEAGFGPVTAQYFGPAPRMQPNEMNLLAFQVS